MLNLNIIVIIFISCLQVIALARNCEGHFKAPLSSETKENLFKFRTHLLSKAESKLISRNRIYSVNEEVIVDGETYRIIGINGESIFTRSYLAEKDGEIFEIERYFERDSFHESLVHLLKIYPETKYKSDDEENSYLLVNHRGDGDDLELAKNRHIARLSEPPYPIFGDIIHVGGANYSVYEVLGMGIEGIVYSVLSESGVLFSAKVFYNKSNAVTSTNRLKSISSSVGRIPKIYNVDLIKGVALTELVLGIPVNKLLDESVATEFLSIEELEILGSQVGELRNQDPRIQMQSIFEISTGDLVRVDAR